MVNEKPKNTTERVDALLQKMNELCEVIATREGFELNAVGGYAMNEDGMWYFARGSGEYVRKDNVMQWKLHSRY